MSNSSTQRKPTPISFAPSQYFEGPDGQWSSFVVRIGTPEQSFRVLPSTVTSETFVPLSGACKQGSPPNCPFSRGTELYKGKSNDGFQNQQSSTWHEIGIYQTATREELGYNASALYGLDSLGLMIANSGGPTLQNQVIAGVVNPRLWVGRLGMDVKPSNFSEFENPQRSLIKTLKDEDYIPGLNYGYTAGAYYKKPNMYGSLVFGGYDQSRFEPNNITFPFDANDSRKPSLNIQSIVTQDFENSTVSMLPNGPVYSLIDFAEPYMWLPVSACDAFANAFNLTYDNSTDLYLVDATTRSQLLDQNPSVTIGLGTTANPGERVNVVLPYSAFDQQANYPIYPNATNYFPIRRAYNDTQYTIGRTFFQEAYFRIDYDRGNFSVHQARFPATNEKQDIVSVPSPKLSDEPTRKDRQQTGRMSNATIAGITVGSAAAITLLSVLFLWLLRRRKRTMQNSRATLEEQGSSVEVADQPKVETEGAALYEKYSRPFAEMDGDALRESQTPQEVPEELYEKDGRHFAEMDGDTLHELQKPQKSSEEMEADLAETNLGTKSEVYEMEGTGRMDLPEHDYKVPFSNQPPPGWI